MQFNLVRPDSTAGSKIQLLVLYIALISIFHICFVRAKTCISVPLEEVGQSKSSLLENCRESSIITAPYQFPSLTILQYGRQRFRSISRTQRIVQRSEILNPAGAIVNAPRLVT